LILLSSLALALSFLACTAGTSAFKKGRTAARQGDWDIAVVHYTRAVNEDPENIEYRLGLERALIESAAYHVQQAQKRLAAEDLEEAIAELELAIDLDPTNRYAQSILEETRDRLAAREALQDEAEDFEQRRRRARELFGQRTILEPSSTAPIQLRFAEDTSLQKIFEVLSKLSGVNVLFDESFRDKRVTVDLVDVSFEDALDKLVLINRLFYKVVDSSTIIIVPDNAQKHRQYDDLVLRTFFIVNAEVNTVANMLRTIAGIQRVQPNPELKSITVRATPDQVAVAERIVDLNDKTKSEIILDIEILEVNRNKVLEYGLRAAEYEIGLGFDPAGQETAGDGDGASAFTRTRLNRLTSTDSSDFVINFPTGASFRLFKSNSEARLLSAPKLRASEGQPAELRLGSEVPIPVTSFVSSFGAGGVPQTPVTSFQYRNIGINVSITPKVFIDGEIELQLSLETSTQLDTRIIGGIELPVFGTRNVNSVVRLRDGETNLIGGLIQQADRKSVAGIPGLTDLPLLSKIFADNSDESQFNDVVFSVTPHIVRAPRVSDSDLAPLPMGTEQEIKVPGSRPFIFDAARDAAVLPQEPESPEPADPEEALDEELDEIDDEMPDEFDDELLDELDDEPDDMAPPQPPPLPPAATNDPTQAGPEPAGPVSILFSPPTASAAVGGQVAVVLLAGGARGLSAGEITISFDENALRLYDVQPGAFLSIDGKPVSFVPTFNPGSVTIVFSREQDTTGLRGSGHLVRLGFEVLAEAPPRVVSARGSLRDATGASLPASFASLRIEVRQ
jgi:general secretion pathway protein D